MTLVNELAQQLLLAVKKREPTLALQRQLQALPAGALREGLTDDRQKKAFWINVYNAFFQILRKEKELEPPGIYRNRLIMLAGEAFSLDDIEHGILRKYRYKRAPEQFSGTFEPELIKSLMVNTVDGRIHFALNCGAVSCPPIAFYRKDEIEEQLDLATQSFLESETTIDADEKTVSTTALLDWYADDFGGEQGVKDLLKDTLGIDIQHFSLQFREYSWQEELHNFV